MSGSPATAQPWFDRGTVTPIERAPTSWPRLHHSRKGAARQPPRAEPPGPYGRAGPVCPGRARPAYSGGSGPSIRCRADGRRTLALMNAGWLVLQLGDVLVPLLGREASG